MLVRLSGKTIESNRDKKTKFDFGTTLRLSNNGTGENILLCKHQWNTRWAFARKLDIFTCENNMLSSHVKISPLLWPHDKSRRTVINSLASNSNIIVQFFFIIQIAAVSWERTTTVRSSATSSPGFFRPSQFLRKKPWGRGEVSVLLRWTYFRRRNCKGLHLYRPANPW